ncbi:CPBP family intramembrane glutamic endopeptidase [Virgisporangium aliadipatigenens]|nr:CPBP family intramembrane glutamic endopeptidase [Virgisporangium aliadipatigenens]
MTTTAPAPVAPPAPAPRHDLPFHRLGRLGRHHWWLPPLATLAVLVGIVVVQLVPAIAPLVAGRPDGPDGYPVFGGATDTWLLVGALGLTIPVVLLAARVLQNRPAGSLSSVTGRLRWRWLGICLLVAVPVPVLTLGGGIALLALTEPAGEAALTLGAWPKVLVGLALTLALVPFQAAGEEYFFRGWLLQAVGGYTRSAIPAIVVSALAFSLAHGLGTRWGFVELVLFGLVTGWLAYRTGGLEAAIALHAVNNVVAFALDVITGGPTNDLSTAADMPWQLFVIDVPLLVAYALVVRWLAGRRRLATTTAIGAT